MAKDKYAKMLAISSTYPAWTDGQDAQESFQLYLQRITSGLNQTNVLLA